MIILNKQFMKNSILFISLLALLLTSCAPENEGTHLDEELLNIMKSISPTNDISYFMLPDQSNYSQIPQDPNNKITAKKVLLGKSLFHESAFGTDGKFPITKEEYSCASCHHAQSGFQAGIAQGLGEGGEGFGVKGESRKRNLLCDAALCDVQPIRSPTILNGAYQPLMLWNGQFGAHNLNIGTEAQWTEGTPKAVNKLGFEGLETQAIAGLKVHRMSFDKVSVEKNGYKDLFDQVFADVPEDSRYNVETAGLAIAAYERTVMAYEAPFQKYLRGNTYQLSDAQKEGAILFFGKAQCSNCHTGPALNSMEFHAYGMNEFNVAEVTHYDPKDPTKLGRASFTTKEEDKYKFKVPQLYNLKNIEFLGHGASFKSIREVIEYKNTAIAQNNEVPKAMLSNYFVGLGLSADEVTSLTDFIKYSLYDPYLDRFVPSSLLSGNCFPNNDLVSQSDLGCK